MLNVSWLDGRNSSYPHIFLRDNCQCPKCFHPVTKSRQLDIVEEVDLDITPQSVSHDKNTDTVEVTWPDNHVSKYSAEWLGERIFPEDVESIVDSTGLKDFQQIPWKSVDIVDCLPFVDYQAIISDDEALLKHLENLLTIGLSIIKNAPKDLTALPMMANKMASSIVRKTNYGLVEVK